MFIFLVLLATADLQAHSSRNEEAFEETDISQDGDLLVAKIDLRKAMGQLQSLLDDPACSLYEDEKLAATGMIDHARDLLEDDGMRVEDLAKAKQSIDGVVAAISGGSKEPAPATSNAADTDSVESPETVPQDRGVEDQEVAPDETAGITEEIPVENGADESEANAQPKQDAGQNLTATLVEAGVQIAVAAIENSNGSSQSDPPRTATAPGQASAQARTAAPAQASAPTAAKAAPVTHAQVAAGIDPSTVKVGETLIDSQGRAVRIVAIRKEPQPDGTSKKVWVVTVDGAQQKYSWKQVKAMRRS